MRHQLGFLILLKLSLLGNTTFGIDENMFLHKYKAAMQNYIMTGHEDGWKQCDILSDGFSYEGLPHILREIDKIQTLNIRATIASSHCLFVIYHVRSMASLTALLDFGLSIIKHLRLALIIQLDSGITFDMATNVTKLPFLVALKSNYGRTQFICPIIGKIESHVHLIFSGSG